MKPQTIIDLLHSVCVGVVVGVTTGSVGWGVFAYLMWISIHRWVSWVRP